MPDPATLGFIGGTGPEGTGLAARFAAAGHPIVIGSRDSGRARDAAGRVKDAVPGGKITGEDNSAAASAGQVVFLTVPYTAQAPLLREIGTAIEHKILVDTIAPLAFQAGRPQPLQVAAGSAAQEAQALLPHARVVAAFHHLSARHLAGLSHPLEGDVLLCGDDRAAKEVVMALVRELEALRPVDAGELLYAGVLESLTAVLIGINRRYRTESGIRIVGLR